MRESNRHCQPKMRNLSMTIHCKWLILTIYQSHVWNCNFNHHQANLPSKGWRLTRIPFNNYVSNMQRRTQFLKNSCTSYNINFENSFFLEKWSWLPSPCYCPIAYILGQVHCKNQTCWLVEAIHHERFSKVSLLRVSASCDCSEFPSDYGQGGVTHVLQTSVDAKRRLTIAKVVWCGKMEEFTYIIDAGPSRGEMVP